MRLSAYECWKQKETQRLSDEQYKNLLIENRIIMNPKEEFETMLFVNMRGSVLGMMVRKGVYEITEECVEVAKKYHEEKSKQNLSELEALKNRNRVLETMNSKYREKLGISNEPIDPLGLVSPLDEIS